MLTLREFYRRKAFLMRQGIELCKKEGDQSEADNCLYRLRALRIREALLGLPPLTRQERIRLRQRLRAADARMTSLYGQSWRERRRG